MPTNKEIFAPLEAAILQHQYDILDILEMVAQFLPESPQIANALCRHARDIMEHLSHETPTPDCAQVIAQAYWRTFYDTEEAKTYGTAIFTYDQAQLQAMTDFLTNKIAGLTEDQALAAQASLLPADSNTH